MNTGRLTRIAVAAILVSLFASPFAAADMPGITVLYDAFGDDPAMSHDWGFAAYIEYEGRRVLFDTGNDAAVFATNVATKDIDLGDLDFAVISHRHGDHSGGLSHLLDVNPDVPVYTAKENFGVFGGEMPGTFLSSDESLPESMRYFGGNIPKSVRTGSAWPEGNFHWADRAIEVLPGFHLIVLEGHWGVDVTVMEVSLAIETPEGLVLVVGCSHPTLERIVEATVEHAGLPVHAIIGGAHLLPAAPAEIRRIAKRLRHDWHVARIAPAHCTGEQAFSVLREVFGDDYDYAGLGTTVWGRKLDQSRR